MTRRGLFNSEHACMTVSTTASLSAHLFSYYLYSATDIAQ